MTEPVEHERVDDGDDVIYQRVVDDDLRMVDVTVFDDPGEPWSFQVGVAIAELVREEPLESRLRREVDVALRDVAGVRDVAEEDREVWIVAGGTADPVALLSAVAAVVDRIAPELEH